MGNSDTLRTAVPALAGGECLISIKQLRPIIGHPSTSTIYRWIEAGNLPPPIRIGPNRVAWKASTIQAWIASKTKTASEEAA